MQTQQQLYYTSTGTGPCVVLLHGFCEDGQIWQAVTPHLQQQYRVICPDLPGFGQSGNKTAQSIAEMADAVYELLMFLGVTKCVLAGHSMGGYVSLALAQKHPSILAGLLLFHSTATADNDAKRSGRQNTIASIQQYGTRPFLTQFFPSLFCPQFALQNPQTLQMLRQRAENISPQAIINALYAMMQRPNLSRLLPDMPFPIAFIAGENDTFVPIATTLAECSLPQSSYLSILPNTAHAGMYENPQLSTEKIKEFTGFCFHIG